MSKGTTARNVRISDDLWTAALAKADERGEVLSEVIRRALEEYVTTSAPPRGGARATAHR